MAVCPGQDMRKLKSAEYECPNCGHHVEIFSDEYRRLCPKCRTEIVKGEAPNCALWCKAAKDCLGPARFKEFFEQAEAAKKKLVAEQASQPQSE